MTLRSPVFETGAYASSATSALEYPLFLEEEYYGETFL